MPSRPNFTAISSWEELDATRQGNPSALIACKASIAPGIGPASSRNASMWLAMTLATQLSGKDRPSRASTVRTRSPMLMPRK